MACSCLFFLAACLLGATAWETPSPHQYHIQTDEGPERYFRYQTDSGQYRKEKRLEDGTVVGTYAWIDGDGFLRQRDYIADGAGYRILKSKNVFVGRSVNVGDAIKSVKKYPASSGTLVKSNQNNQIDRNRRPVVTHLGTSYGVPTSTAYYPISTTTQIPPYGSGTVTSTTPAGIAISSTEAPLVEITPNSYQRQTVISTPSPLLTAPGNFTTYTPSNYLPPITTTAPPTRYIPVPQTSYDPIYPSDQNSLEYNPYVQQVDDNDYRFRNGPTYPLDRNGRPFSGQRIGDGYDPQYPRYDGISVTNDGFRYYIPRAYHEEQTQPGDKRSGSFGYIDPFGIRRVVYYNTAPGSGFQHKKNNRYVGFDATPYDPRPY